VRRKEQSIRGLAQASYELSVRHKNGSIRHLEVLESPLFNAEGKVASVEGIAHDVTARKQAEQERERLIQELQAALAQVKTLSGLLPICAHCKKIRDDKGRWNPMEIFIRDRSNASFTHGICPECARHFYPHYSPGPTEK
jgi:uncharacterized protein YqfB (UPF0267 family)